MLVPFSSLCHTIWYVNRTLDGTKYYFIHFLKNCTGKINEEKNTRRRIKSQTTINKVCCIHLLGKWHWGRNGGKLVDIYISSNRTLWRWVGWGGGGGEMIEGWGVGGTLSGWKGYNELGRLLMKLNSPTSIRKVIFLILERFFF